MAYRTNNLSASIVMTLVLTVFMLIAGMNKTVAAQNTSPPLGKKKIVYAHGTWSSGRVVTAAVSIMLKRIGYDVKQKLLGTGLAYQAMASGAVDLWSSAFLPGQQAFFNKYGDKLDILSMSYTPTPGGLMVPAYMSINTIDDLRKPAIREKLDGKITGIDAGAGVVKQARQVVKAYGLDYKIVTSSSAAMAAAFESAYDQRKPIVVTGWCPHVLCALYKTKFLEDTKGAVYGANRDFHVGSLDFRKDHPRAAVLIGRMTFNEGQVSKMLVWMKKDNLSANQAAKRFLKKNPDLVWYWAGGLAGGLKKPEMLVEQ